MTIQRQSNSYRCISCGRSISYRQTGALPCPCCEHLAWYENDYAERSISAEESQKIMADLRKGRAIRTTEKDPAPLMTVLVAPYIRSIGRKIHETWQYGGSTGLGYTGYGELLAKGLKVCELREISTGKNFSELWVVEQGPILVQGSLERAWADDLGHEILGGQIWHVGMASLSFDHDTVQHHATELADKCWEALCAYADKRVRVETFPEEEIRGIFKDFYFTGDLGLLCEFAFNYVLHDILDNHKTDDRLLDLTKARLESGGVDRYCIQIVELLEGKENALRYIARDFKSGKLGNREMSRFWRNKMHSLGAKQLLGWCPCDLCSANPVSSGGMQVIQ